MATKAAPPAPVTPPIQGFQLLVSSNELREHFTTRLGFHKTALEKLGGGVVKLIGVDGGQSEMIQKHKEQVRLLNYIINHLPADEQFRLSLNELGGLMVLDNLVDE